MSLTSDVISAASDTSCVMSTVTQFVVEQFALFNFVFSLDFIFFTGAKIFRLNSCWSVKLGVEVVIADFPIAAKHEQRISLEWQEETLTPRLLLLLRLITIWSGLFGRRRREAVGTLIDKSHFAVNESVIENSSQFIHPQEISENWTICRRQIAPFTICRRIGTT